MNNKKTKLIRSLKGLQVLIILALSTSFSNAAVAMSTVDHNDVVFETSNTNLLAKDGLSRGEATDAVVKFFDLELQNQKFLAECDAQPDLCLFAFVSRTNFSDLLLDPIILYPDVFPAYKYYKSINIATKLDLVRGYFDVDNSPYKPEQKITKIETLKLIFGASGLAKWKDKFEFDLDKSGQQEKQNWVVANDWVSDKWWYARYLFLAISNGVINKDDYFLPNADISKVELINIMEKTKNILAS